MDIKINSQSERRVAFTLTGANAAFANAFRRIMMHEVATMAIENVDIEVNTSGMFDEIVAHRLGLVPLTFDRDVYTMKEGGKGEGKSQYEVVLVIDKEGPCVVRAGDMKSTADDVRPVDGNIPIVELLSEQKFKCEAVAQLGLGTQHIKWQAAVVGYQAKDHSFIFDVESVCGLSAAAIIDAALGSLAERADTFGSELKKA